MEGAWICEMFPQEINFQVKIVKAFAVITVVRGFFHCGASTANRVVQLPEEHSVHSARCWPASPLVCRVLNL